MATGTQAFKVGIFVALSGAAAYGIYRYVSPEVSGGSGYTVHAYIRDATGLAQRSRVTIAGIPVGTLESIRLENGQARLDVRVKNDIALYDNGTLGKKSTSLLGESVVVLTPGTPDHVKLHEGDEIHVILSETTPADLMEEVKEIADSVKAVAQQLAASIGTEQGGQNIKAILQNVADATDALNKTIRENREVIRDTLRNVEQITGNANPQIASILENVRVVTQDVRQLMAAANETKAGKKGDLRDTIEHLDQSSKSLQSALDHVDNITGRIDRGEGTVGRLTKDDALINEVQGVAEGVNDYVQNITRLQTIVGLRSDYNFLANTIKSYVSLRLQPTEDKYYEIELVNDPNGLTSITDQSVDTTNPTQPAHYRTITTTTTDSFRFSLQFAKRMGPFTGRFGIKESTGGLGLDIHLLNDRFEIVNDLFGFSEFIQPRYRVYVSYEFLKRLWIYAGVDYLFEPSLRDYFLGLQLRFNDEDLKTILPFSGGAAAVAK
ncbi:MAG TPA: MlaD family protein [Polyangiaceae bacterium]|jgi:phospholipid/cholesterol/gamma-HCH transport system substrate-binding protein